MLYGFAPGECVCVRERQRRAMKMTEKTKLRVQLLGLEFGELNLHALSMTNKTPTHKQHLITAQL